MIQDPSNLLSPVRIKKKEKKKQHKIPKKLQKKLPMNYNEKVVPAHLAKKEREKKVKGSSSKKTSNVKRS